MSFSPDSSTTAGRGANVTTPTGAQGQAVLGLRRRLVIVLNAATYLILMTAASVVIDGLGWTAAGVVMLACFAIGLPWAVLGFWNAVIGLALLHCSARPLDRVAP